VATIRAASSATSRLRPLHYLPVLLRKLGALRNGAPFKDWICRPSLAQVRAKLQHHDDGDRQFVKVLGLVPDHGIAAVEDGLRRGLEAGIANGDVVTAILARRRQPPVPPSITNARTPSALPRNPSPTAPGYDTIRPKETPKMERHQIIEAMTSLKLYGMRASFDEIVGKGLRRREELYPLLASLISGRVRHRQSRSINYRIAAPGSPC